MNGGHGQGPNSDGPGQVGVADSLLADRQLSGGGMDSEGAYQRHGASTSRQQLNYPWDVNPATDGENMREGMRKMLRKSKSG